MISPWISCRLANAQKGADYVSAKWIYVKQPGSGKPFQHGRSVAQARRTLNTPSVVEALAASAFPGTKSKNRRPPALAGRGHSLYHRAQAFGHYPQGYEEATKISAGIALAWLSLGRQMRIRHSTESDYRGLASLLFKTVHNVNVHDYSPEQILAWAPSIEVIEESLRSRRPRDTYVALDGPEIIGFAVLETNGHIDCFYVSHLHQGQGIGSALFKQIRTEAANLQLNRLFSEVSLTARPFFQRHGFVVTHPQEVFCRGVSFRNFRMEKNLKQKGQPIAAANVLRGAVSGSERER